MVGMSRRTFFGQTCTEYSKSGKVVDIVGVRIGGTVALIVDSKALDPDAFVANDMMSLEELVKSPPAYVEGE